MLKRSRQKKERGQALTEFILIAPLLIVICLAIIQFMHWTRISIEVQNGAWYTVRSQTGDWIWGPNSPVSSSSLLDVLQGSIFSFYGGDAVTNVSLDSGVQSNDAVAAILGTTASVYLDPFDLSFIRQASVTATTPFLPEAGPYPDMKGIFGQSLAVSNGRTVLTASASESIFTSWTSLFTNPSFNENAANNNYNQSNDCSQLENDLANAQNEVNYYNAQIALYEGYIKNDPDNKDVSSWKNTLANDENQYNNYENLVNQLGPQVEQCEGEGKQ